MTDKDALRRIQLLAVAIMLSLCAVSAMQVLHITNNHDFAVYFKAAQRLLSGGDIYADTAAFRAQVEGGLSTKSEDTPWPYAYPPLLAAAISPLTLMPYAWASLAWTAFCIAAIAAAVYLALRSQAWLTLGGLLVALLLLYEYDPAVVGLRLGQVDIAIFLCLALALVWLKEGHDALAGMVLGLAIGIKLFAAFLVIFLLWKRRWRAALWAAVTGALLLVVPFLALGLDSVKPYVDFGSLYTSGSFAGYSYHQSFNAFLTRQLKPNMFMQPLAELPWLADAVTVLLSATVVGAMFWLSRRPIAASSPRFDLEYGLAITTMLLVIPPAPRYSFIWLLLAFVIVAAHLVRGAAPVWVFALFSVAYVLTARLVYLPVPFLRRLVMDGQFMLGAMLLWATIAWLLSRRAKQEELT